MSEREHIQGMQDALEELIQGFDTDDLIDSPGQIACYCMVNEPVLKARIRTFAAEVRKLAREEAVQELKDKYNGCNHTSLHDRCHGCTARMVTQENIEAIRALKDKEVGERE